MQDFELGVTGNFDSAVQCLISELIALKRKAESTTEPIITYRDISELLSNWDKRRGQDWFTQTRRGLWGAYED